MMPFGFLPALDAVLQSGAMALSQSLRNHIARFATSQQTPDGGFRGRLGKSDLYYTDFGMRTWRLVNCDMDPLIDTGPFIHQLPPPRDILECFNLLNIYRMMQADSPRLSLNRNEIYSVIHKQQLPGGGYSRPQGTLMSAYHSFLAILCYEMLGDDLPDRTGTLQALTALRNSDGGYCETAGEPHSQTNATAAAVACLTLHGGISAKEADHTAEFLANMQSPGGGLRAVTMIDEADLLSTFTGMVCLSGLGDLGHLDLPQTARYIRGLLTAEGGFRASVSDGEADIEYTYYGLGALSLLKVYALSSDT